MEILLERRVYGPAYSRAEEGNQNVAHSDDTTKKLEVQSLTETLTIT